MPTPAIITALEKRAMTAVVNKRYKGKKALTSLLFPLSSELNLTHEWVHVDVLTGEAGMAPFIEKNGKAIAVGQLNGESYMLETPNINIKRPITASEELLKRQAGESVFSPNGDDVYRDAMEAQITRDLDFMEELIENRVEWMIAQLLQGEISYSVEGGASFKITTAKPAGNTFTVSNLWDGASPAPLNDIKAAKRVVQPYAAPGFQIALCGENASNAISKMLEEDTIKAIKNDSGIVAGMGDLIADFQENGMLYLGTFGGIPFFEYAGTYIADGTGTVTPFIRTDYVEFIATARPETRTLYNGAKVDAEAILSGMHIGRRFATSELDKDVGTYVAWLKARPMPWMTHPEYNVSMKVT